MMKKINPENVIVTGGLFRERMNLNIKYLKELDTYKLLQNFYLEAGINHPVLNSYETLHKGWEAPSCQLRGHFLGHFMSACANVVAHENDTELSAKLKTIVDELYICQQENGGKWAGSIPEKYFERIKNNKYVWSPQYVMHKTFMGLIDTYVLTGNKKALEIADNMGDWYVNWAKTAGDAVYRGEQGGMLEIWAKLYKITKNDKYLALISAYEGNGFFDKLDKKVDALTNDHANAGIPLTHGAMAMYEITGDEKWLTRLKEFWNQAITSRGMFATGGQNSGEFWVPPFKEGSFLGINTQEYCTVYNLVRTAEFLFMCTGEKEYSDYIERCLYNGFLAQQNPYTGMPAYFLPLKFGSKKKWGSKTEDFWCCHGTMVQGQTIYPDLIYYEDENSLTVSQYIPSVCTLDKITLEQNTDMSNYNSQVFFDDHSNGEMSRWSFKFTVQKAPSEKYTLRFRIPEWVNGEPAVTLNGEKCEYVSDNGFISVERVWNSGESVGIFFPHELREECLPDIPELAAFMDGPVVLAGLTEDCSYVKGGVKNLYPEVYHTYSTYPWLQSTFVTKNNPVNIEFKPLYEIADEAYTVYFNTK